MSHETSPSTHRPYGIARVTRVWQVPRSTVYAQRNRRARPTPVAKRGPKPPQSDAELTAAVRAVIAASPFHGEGHRKIWARLRVQGLRTSKRRTLVVMRAADLLGPARLPTPVAARPHDGTIVTASPNVMWGTDATATVTLADGHVTIFGAIDHCTAECVGLHAAVFGSYVLCDSRKVILAYKHISQKVTFDRATRLPRSIGLGSSGGLHADTKSLFLGS